MPFIRRMSALTALIIVTATFSAAHAQERPAMPEALKHAPDSAHLVVVVPDLDAANQAIGNFTQQLGIPAPPNMGPLDAMLMEVGVAKGVDRNGSAALVMPFLQLMGEPKMYLVLPLADEQQFRANFTALEASTDTEGVLIGRPAQGGMGQDLCVKLVDGYAILAEQEETLEDHAVSADASTWMDRAGPLGRRAAEDVHGFVLVNMEKVGPMVQGMFNMGLMQMQQQMQAMGEMGGMAGPGADPASIEAVIALYRQLGKMVLSESRQLTLGVDLDQGGLDYDLALQFKPESTGAKVFAAGGDEGEGGLSLDRLADKPFLLAMAWDNRAIDMQPLVEVMRRDVVNQLGEESAGRDLIELYADGMAMMKDFDSAQIAWFAPEGPGMDALFNIAGVYVADDPEQFYDQTAALYRRLVDVMNKAAASDEAGMAPKAYFEPNAATLDGSPVSKFGFEMPEGMAGGMGGMGMPMMSPEAMTYWIAPSEAGMLFAMGPDHKALQTVKQTAGGGGGLTARAAIADGRKTLPANRFSEVHFDIAGMMKGMMDAMMGQMGGGGPQIPDLPPVSVALSSEAGGGAVYAHVPTEMIQGAVQSFMMMGMGGPGGPGGPMPPGVEVVPPQGGFEAEPQPAEPMGDGDNAAAGSGARARAEVTEIGDGDWASAVLQADGPVLVELYADWADPAIRQQPITDALARQFAGQVKMVRVDIDANPQIVERLQPKTLPTLVILHGGQTVETFEGPTARSALAEALEKAAE